MIDKLQIATMRADAKASGDSKVVALCDAAFAKGLKSVEWNLCDRLMNNRQATAKQNAADAAAMSRVKKGDV